MKTWFVLIFTCLFIGCSIPTGKKQKLAYALQMARSNQSELKEVLNYFKDDELKLQAAEFLIGNMVEEFHIDSTSVQFNQVYFDALEKLTITDRRYAQGNRRFVCDSIYNKLAVKNLHFNVQYRSDLETISAKFLIDHIEQSFVTWQSNPWSQCIDFETFCRYILPYKSGNDYWDGLYPYYREKYAWLRDSFPTKSYIDVGNYIIKDIKANFIQDNPLITIHFPFLYPMRVRDVFRTNLGVCDDLNNLIIAALRSVGIPAAKCMIPYWGNSNDAHSWCEIIGDTVRRKYDNEQSPYSKPEDEIVDGIFWTTRILPSLKGIPSDVRIAYCRTIPKVYRRTYEVDLSMWADRKNQPGFFRNLKMNDISDRYINCCNLSLALDDTFGQKNVYLACYDPNSLKWIPAAKGEIKHKKAYFEKVGVNVAYLPMIIDHGKLLPVSAPLFVNSKGEMTFFKADIQNLYTTKLSLKLPFRYYIAYLFSLIQGGQFQLANRKDLKDAFTVCTIDSLPYYDQIINIEGSPSARYAVYNFQNSASYMAELEFWGISDGKLVPLKGELIGNTGNYRKENSKICDKDRVSYFEGKEGEVPYVGFDFKTPQKIAQIRFVPRSDDNHVVAGRTYELFYWDDKWISLGQHVASEDNTVEYDNIPENALLRLHCVTTGKEHRIFSMENDIQVFY